MIARAVGPERFGAFVLVFGTYTVLLGVCRGIVAEPLVIRYSISPTDTWRTATGSATGTAIVLGIVAAGACLVAGWTLDGELGGSFLALAVCAPGLLLQDVWRFAFIANRRSGSAFINDLIWAVVLAPMLGFSLLGGNSTLPWLILAWGGAATVAAVAGSLQGQLAPRPVATLRWLRVNGDLGRLYSVESLATTSAELVVMLLITGIVGLAAIGAIQAAGLLLGPINVLFQAAGLVVVPELVRLAARRPRRLWSTSCAVSLLSLAAPLGLGAMLLLVPAPAGRTLLGASWDPARAVLVPLVVMMASSGAANGAQFGLRAVAAAKRSLAARIASSLLLVVTTSLGAGTGGIEGAAWGLAAGRCLSSIVWWLQFARALRRPLLRRLPVASGVQDEITFRLFATNAISEEIKCLSGGHVNGRRDRPCDRRGGLHRPPPNQLSR
jgi:O-antigen/teichoic acid export membrane protein